MITQKIYGIVKNMRKIKALLINILILVIVSLLIFSIVEISLRVFYPQLTIERAEKISPKVFEDSDYTPWKLKPNTSDRLISGIGNEYNVLITINSYGLRDSEIYPEEIVTKTIIGVIGDSFTFGSGVESKDTYPKKLEKMLNLESEKFRVINMGRADGSLTTDVQYLYLKKKGLDFNPKIIILGYFTNDITDIKKKTIWLSTDEKGDPTNITTTWTYIDEEGRYRRNYNISTKDRSLFYKINRFMSDWSHLHMFLKLFYIGTFLNKPDPNHVYVHPEDYLKKFDISKRMLVEINKMLQANDATLVVMLIPAQVQVDAKAWKSYEKYYGENAYRFNPQNEIMEFCNEKNIKCLDLLPYFMEKSELYFKIDGHWNEKGHDLAAIKLYEYLINEGLT